ncbi:hypothetical protein [Rhizobium sp. Leaf262]|uniref:hypothetical protein n=1 Tax=Rhizobium sp. Leaf262 TaxID=1736312 RepID=UPI000714089F|nr:hypothetical protein [Rhizobium sp. Leaf262]KQO80234.1 hypothetical protein ASF29_19950 [Rhizobium sp. Leaf262]
MPPNSDWARSNGSTVRLPDGTALDSTGTVTDGVQEAINFACGNGLRGSGNSDLEIIGGSEKTGNYQLDGQAVFDCVGGIVFPAMQGKFIKMGAITLNVSSGAAAGITFDSMMMVDVDMSASQLVFAGLGNALKFKPTVVPQIDGIAFGIPPVITDSRLKLGHIANVNTANTTP